MAELKLGRVNCAVFTPFTDKFKVDEDVLREHLRDLLKVEGLGLVANAHSGEGFTLTREECKRIARIYVDEAKGKAPVTVCILVESTEEAVARALDAKEVGANAVMLATPTSWLTGMDPKLAYPFMKEVIERSGMPMVVFQYPHFWGSTYGMELLIRLVTLKGVVAIKDAVWEALRYEKDYRAIKAAAPHVAVLTGNDLHLLANFTTGADGALVAYGALLPREIKGLFDACKRGDLKEAKAIHDRIWPVTEVVFGPPFLNMYARAKEALVMLGRLPNATVRPPLLPIAEDERKKIRKALELAGLL